MNVRTPWHTDRPLPDATAHDLVRSQFPELRATEVTRRSEGWDFDAVEVDREWIFRFPKRKSEDARLDREITVLAVIAADLPVAIPHYECFGHPDERFPYRFAGYPKLPGITAMEHDSPRADDLAPQLGEFLSALHSISCETMATAGVLVVAQHERIEHEWIEARQLLARLCERPDRVMPADLAEACVEYFRLTPSALSGASWQPRFLHNDLRPEHLLLSDRGDRLAGIIDWTDMEIGDPAMDFAALHAWQGRRFLRQVVDHYRHPVDDDFENRTLLIGLNGCLDDIWYGVETSRPEYVRQGLRGMRTMLSSMDRG